MLMCALMLLRSKTVTDTVETFIVTKTLRLDKVLHQAELKNDSDTTAKRSELSFSICMWTEKAQAAGMI